MKNQTKERGFFNSIYFSNEVEMWKYKNKKVWRKKECLEKKILKNLPFSVISTCLLSTVIQKKILVKYYVKTKNKSHLNNLKIFTTFPFFVFPRQDKSI